MSKNLKQLEKEIGRWFYTFQSDWIKHGRRYEFRLDDYPENLSNARTCYEEARRLWPNEPIANYRLARVLQKQKKSPGRVTKLLRCSADAKYEPAIKVLLRREVNKRSEGSKHAKWIALGDLKEDSNERNCYLEASLCYLAALKSHPNDRQTYFKLSCLFLVGGHGISRNERKAERYFDSAIKTRNQETTQLFFNTTTKTRNQGAAQYVLNRIAESRNWKATQHLATLLMKRLKQNPKADDWLALGMKYQKNHPEYPLMPLFCYEKALKKNQYHPETSYQIALLLEPEISDPSKKKMYHSYLEKASLKGHRKATVKWIRLELTDNGMSDTNPDDLAYLGKIQCTDGPRPFVAVTVAQVCFEKALELSPNHQEASKWLKRLTKHLHTQGKQLNPPAP